LCRETYPGRILGSPLKKKSKSARKGKEVTPGVTGKKEKDVVRVERPERMRNAEREECLLPVKRKLKKNSRR